MVPAEPTRISRRHRSCTPTVSVSAARDCAGWHVPGLVDGAKQEEKAISRLRATDFRTG
jgi:hypothetical protein